MVKLVVGSIVTAIDRAQSGGYLEVDIPFQE
jgi:hypothetical protein